MLTKDSWRKFRKKRNKYNKSRKPLYFGKVRISTGLQILFTNPAIPGLKNTF